MLYSRLGVSPWLLILLSALFWDSPILGFLTCSPKCSMTWLKRSTRGTFGTNSFTRRCDTAWFLTPTPAPTLTFKFSLKWAKMCWGSRQICNTAPLFTWSLKWISDCDCSSSDSLCPALVREPLYLAENLSSLQFGWSWNHLPLLTTGLGLLWPKLASQHPPPS